jgi:type IV secretion system protein VirB10
MAKNSGFMSNDPAGAGDNRIEEDRGIPQVGRKGKANKALVAVVAVSAFLVVVSLAGYLLYSKLNGSAPKETANTLTAESTLPSLTEDAFNKNNAPPPPPPPGVTGVEPSGNPAAAGQPPANQPPQPTPEQKAAMDRAERRKRAPVLAFSENSAAPAETGQGSGSTGANGRGPLGRSLQATRTDDTAASMLADPSMTITQGTFIDCTLQTAINSTLAGMTSCVLTRNVYSTNGRVLLLERGSKVVGQYQSGQLRQGMRRIFMLWTRIETPSGVLINIDSPATDALGRSGVDGRINNHFWMRFGSAMLISLVDDLAQYAVEKQRDQSTTGDNTRIEFGSTADSANDAAAIIVQNTVNIPPTLEKHQGAHMGIYVARDLYFGEVYGLASANRN